mgnify:FL=1
MAELRAGIDTGKRTHHLVLIDVAGEVHSSQKVANEESDLLEVIARVFEVAQGREVCWATDLTDGGAALVIAWLAAHDQEVLYIPGRIIHHAAGTYRGDGKTEAKDARIIADQARMRTDLPAITTPDEVALGLKLLPSHRLDVIRNFYDMDGEGS